MENLPAIEYSEGLTNPIIKFPNSLNQVKTIKILGDNAYMEERAFSYFESLHTVEFKQSTNILYISKFAFLGCKTLSKINIPSSCMSIEEGAFKDCISIQSIEFKGNNLKNIQKDTFCNCISLKEIMIPSSVSAICQGAFLNCNSLEKFEINDISQSKLKVIEKNCFRNYSSLKCFVLPSKCITVGPAAFMNCNNLEIFIYEGSEISSIQSRTFLNCKLLKQIKIINIRFKLNKFNSSNSSKKAELDFF